MTASVFTEGTARCVAIPCERPAREPSLELERVARFAVGCAALAQPGGVEWKNDALVVSYPDGALPTLADVGSVERARALRWLESLAEALATLHDLGVAHGHLRPELVAVRGDDVLLLGFGVEVVARAVGGASLAAAILPERYRAPEQRGESPDAASPWTDTYAFGVVAAELLGEASPLCSESMAERPSDLRRFVRSLAVPAAPGGPAPEPSPEPSHELQQPELAPQAPSPPPSLPRVPPPPVSQPPRGSAFPILAMATGLALMVLGVAALFVFAVVRRDPKPPAAPTPVPVASILPAPPPPALPDAGRAGAPDAGAEPEAVEVPELSASDVTLGVTVSAADGSAEIPLDESVPVWGKIDAPATLVVFGDLECPHTRRAISVVIALKKALGDDLRLAWRHRPLSGNDLAREAAETAAALHAEHGAVAFWKLLGEAARDGGAPTEARLGSWIERAGGDRARVLAARSKHAARVDRDLALAGRFDVRQTPTFFLNGLQIQGFLPLSELRRRIQTEIVAARSTLAAGAGAASLYATRVRKNLIGLGPDVAIRTCPDLGRSPGRGASSPLVTIVEFSDFECPYCKRVQPALERVLARHGGDVRLVWKNLPLPAHSRARPAAALALEGFERGGASRFWQLHDLLFEASGALNDEQLSQIAARAGLEAESALEAVRRGDHEASIGEDVKLAKKLGASGTPTFFVNGRKIEGAQSYEKLRGVIEEEIDAAKRLIGGGTPRARIYEAICGAR